MKKDDLIDEIRDEMKLMKTGVQLIAEEREDQITKGWTADHDDRHVTGMLAMVGAVVASHDTQLQTYVENCACPDWGIIRKHPRDRIHQLAIAGALIAAEIDRLQREALQKGRQG